jgi:Reverse transcriptase (RNA-dependent DNA polymerase)
VLNDFHDHKIDLWRINKAHISLIPKKQGSNRLEDFRPISILSFIPKIITKILADCLSTVLPNLISKHQTAFIQGRSITETFLLACQSLKFLHKERIPSVLLKINFRKAFDTLSWNFLLALMQIGGFLERWITWIRNLLISSSSFVKLNGEEGTHFFHMRDLRQGDPLSPMLFILAMQSLQSLLQEVQPNLVQTPDCITELLQFADDAILFTPAHPQNLATIIDVLDKFADRSGLRMNRQKSGYVPIAIPRQHITTITSLLSVNPLQLPITYLGLPLTHRKPTNALFQPLLTALER